jgi:hypothetical protein
MKSVWTRFSPSTLIITRFGMQTAISPASLIGLDSMHFLSAQGDWMKRAPRSSMRIVVVPSLPSTVTSRSRSMLTTLRVCPSTAISRYESWRDRYWATGYDKAEAIIREIMRILSARVNTRLVL